jgi:hypothetical protein
VGIPVRERAELVPGIVNVAGIVVHQEGIAMFTGDALATCRVIDADDLKVMGSPECWSTPSVLTCVVVLVFPVIEVVIARVLPNGPR